MADKTWKRRERDVAKALGGRRIPVTGERDGADVLTPIVAVQVKHGRRRPSYLRDWLDGILARRRGRRLGVVVWSAPREKVTEGVVVMPFADFAALVRDLDALEALASTYEDHHV